jgi:hypothetical protein
MAKRNGEKLEPRAAELGVELPVKATIPERPWEITEDELRAMLGEWKTLPMRLDKFLSTRGVLPEYFFDALRKYNLFGAYKDIREVWQLRMDRNLIQQALVNVMDALEAGDVETSRWVLERRFPFHFSDGKTQLMLQHMERMNAAMSDMRNDASPVLLAPDIQEDGR